MFNFFYVNQVIHIVILVDNVDKFVYNLIISGFSDFCHVENFLESFSLIHHGSTDFVHFARKGVLSSALDTKNVSYFEKSQTIFLIQFFSSVLICYNPLNFRHPVVQNQTVDQCT